jgi:hypothetical protein
MVMKRIFIASMIAACVWSNISAINYYQKLSLRISEIGRSIEKIDSIPVMGKLTNVLPITALVAGLKECPLQTMIVLMGLGAYVIAQNETVRELVNRYELTNSMPWLQRNHWYKEKIDPSIFIYDAQEEELEDIEDELLGTSLFGDDDDDDDMKSKNKKELMNS